MIKKTELLKRIENLEDNLQKLIAIPTKTPVPDNPGGFYKMMPISIAVDLLAEYLGVEFEYPDSKPKLTKVKVEKT